MQFALIDKYFEEETKDTFLAKLVKENQVYILEIISNATIPLEIRKYKNA
jgi:hypothetical protein